MAKKPVGPGKKNALPSETLMAALRESGLINADASIADVMEQVSKAERDAGGEVEKTVVYDSNKWFMVMP